MTMADAAAPRRFAVAHPFPWKSWSYRAGESFTEQELDERGLSDAAREIFAQRGLLAELPPTPTEYGRTAVSPNPAEGSGGERAASARPQSQPRAAKRPLRQHDE